MSRCWPNNAVWRMPSMPSLAEVLGGRCTAEHAFREAFDRLKRNCPQILPPGTPVSQNNVAKEAGRDPSALRKSRYPSLIEEIQRWLATSAPTASNSQRQTLAARRERTRTQKERLQNLKAQRDSLASLLVEADAKILELTLENARLHSLLPATKVTPILRRTR